MLFRSDRLRTSNRRVYAVGDVAGGYQLTHMANHHAGIVLRNILFRLASRVEARAVPWVTYTAPELAQVGQTEAEARRDLREDLDGDDLAGARRWGARERDVDARVQLVDDADSPRAEVNALASRLDAHGAPLVLDDPAYDPAALKPGADQVALAGPAFLPVPFPPPPALA